jgi:hypothetical protein
VAYLQGNVGGCNGSGTMIGFVGVNMLIPAAGTPMYGQQPFLVQDCWDLLAWGATPSELVGECARCFFCSIDTRDKILLADNSNGSPGDVGFFGGIVEAGRAATDHPALLNESRA